MTKAWPVLLVSGALLIAACGASAPVPESALTTSKADIRAAQAVGAPNVPQAALHLKMARDQVAEAQGLIKNGQNTKAQLVLDRADADAQLAIALTRSKQLKAEAARAIKKVHELKAQGSE